MDDNPVTRRLEKLYAQWERFAQDPDARILRWLVTADEVPFVRSFVVAQMEGDDGDLPDSFVRLETAFTDGRGYGAELVATLAEQYRQAAPALEEEGIAPTWAAPVGQPDAMDVQVVVDALRSFREVHGDPEGVLAVWLAAPRVHDLDAFQLWLQRFAYLCPPEVRLLVLDSVEAPVLAVLARKEARLVVSTTASLDVGPVLEEISLGAGNLDTAGGRFRHLFVQMAAAGRAGDLERAERLANEATPLAERVGWPHLAATVQMALGALYSAGQRLSEAAGAFRAAHDSAARCAGETAMYGPRLQLQSRLSLGSTLIAAKGFALAAKAFRQGAELARSPLADAAAELDAWRLASFAHELDGEFEEAWQCAVDGLRVAKGMDDDMRASSTLPFLADAIWRLTRQRSLAHYWGPVEPRLGQLLGAAWRPNVRTTATTPDVSGGMPLP